MNSDESKLVRTATACLEAATSLDVAMVEMRILVPAKRWPFGPCDDYTVRTPIGECRLIRDSHSWPDEVRGNGDAK